MTNKYETMQDWELEREVLTRLGYKLFVDGSDVYLLDQEGNKHWRETGLEHTDHFWYTYYGTRTAHTEDLDTACKLPLPAEHQFEIHIGEEGHSAFVNQIGDQELIERSYANGDTGKSPAATVVMAWLLFMDAQKAATP